MTSRDRHDALTERREQARLRRSHQTQLAQSLGRGTVDVLQMDQGDPIGVAFGDQHRIRPTEREVTGVEAQGDTAAVEEAIELVGLLDERVDVRVQHLSDAVLGDDRVDVVETGQQGVPRVGVERRPLPHGEVGDHRGHETLPACGRDRFGDLRGAFAHLLMAGAVVEDERHESADERHAVPLERRAQHVRIRREPAERALLHRPQPEPRGFSEDAVDRQLQAPTRHLTDTP